MKKLTVVLVLLTSLVASAQSDSVGFDDVDFYMSVYIDPIYMGDLYGIAISKQDTLSPLCKKYMGYKKDVFSACEEHACRTVLDSNYYMSFPEYYNPHIGYVDGGRSIVFEFIGTRGANHTPFEVVRDQLEGWSRCRLLYLTEAQVDSLVNRIQTKTSEIWPFEEPGHAGKVVRYESFCLNTTFKNDSTVDCVYLDRYDYIPNYHFPLPIVDEDYESTDVSVRLQRNSPGIQVIGGRLVAPASLVGRPYSLLDLNGRVLQSGQLEQNMPLPHHPVVLKIKDQKEIFIKN